MKHMTQFLSWQDWVFRAPFSCHTCGISEGLFKIYTLSSRILYECSDLIDFYKFLDSRSKLSFSFAWDWSFHPMLMSITLSLVASIWWDIYWNCGIRVSLTNSIGRLVICRNDCHEVGRVGWFASKRAYACWLNTRKPMMRRFRFSDIDESRIKIVFSGTHGNT